MGSTALALAQPMVQTWSVTSEVTSPLVSRRLLFPNLAPIAFLLDRFLCASYKQPSIYALTLLATLRYSADSRKILRLFLRNVLHLKNPVSAIKDPVAHAVAHCFVFCILQKSLSLLDEFLPLQIGESALAGALTAGVIGEIWRRSRV